MTREEAINELEALKQDYCDDDGYGHETKQYDDTMLALDMAIEALNQKWIPVTERLPDKDGLYLVSVKNDHERRYSKTCWYSDKNWFARQDVVAWMPLPEPYKGGE